MNTFTIRLPENPNSLNVSGTVNQLALFDISEPYKNNRTDKNRTR